MGSLTSKPKTPAIAAPAPVQSFVAAPVVAAPVPVTQNPASPPLVATPEEVRTASLLSRDRGRFGTILTSFRGFLGQTAQAPKRKTLLGE
jgi:hypothetical protein